VISKSRDSAVMKPVGMSVRGNFRVEPREFLDRRLGAHRHDLSWQQISNLHDELSSPFARPYPDRLVLERNVDEDQLGGDVCRQG
jgi:hypothetical protein